MQLVRIIMQYDKLYNSFGLGYHEEYGKYHSF